MTFSFKARTLIGQVPRGCHTGSVRYLQRVMQVNSYVEKKIKI